MEDVSGVSSSRDSSTTSTVDVNPGGSDGYSLATSTKISDEYSSSATATGGATDEESPVDDSSYDDPIRDGQRHPLCGGEYLDACELGPYSSVDVGDGSCQQHLNTEGCHYDGGRWRLVSNVTFQDNTYLNDVLVYVACSVSVFLGKLTKGRYVYYAIVRASFAARCRDNFVFQFLR